MSVAEATCTAFGPTRQIDAGVLNVGYVDAGPPDGPTVVLLHGWPYDIHAYADVTPLLAPAGYRVDRPVPPRLRHDAFPLGRDASQRRAGRARPRRDRTDGRARDRARRSLPVSTGAPGSAGIVAALWPDRCKALVSVSGYLIGSREANRKPLPPSAELAWWYQFYFATERGRAGYEQYRHEFAKLIWQTASPQWDFDDDTFDRSAASFENADHVDIVIHNYRWRIGVADGEPHYDEMEEKLAQGPPITVPTITLEGDANGAPHPEAASYRDEVHRPVRPPRLTGGVGHNLPQEAPRAFADGDRRRRAGLISSSRRPRASRRPDRSSRRLADRHPRSHSPPPRSCARRPTGSTSSAVVRPRPAGASVRARRTS